MADYAYPKALTGMQDTQWSTFMASIVDDGATSPNAFAPSANGSGMVATLGAGEAIVRGILTGDASTANVTIAAAPAAGSSRIDTIVKRLDRSGTPVIKTAVLTGNVAASGATPAPKALTQDAAGIWEWPVADVLVTGGTVSLTADKITDRRTFTGTNVGAWSKPPASARPFSIAYNKASGKWQHTLNGTTWADLVDLGTIPVSKGGTGATAISLQLLANLGIVVSKDQPAAGTAILWAKRA